MSKSRDQLEPIIRAIGIREVARRCQATGVEGLDAPLIHRWLTGGGRLKDHQLDAIASVCGLEVHYRKIRKKSRRTA